MWLRTGAHITEVAPQYKQAKENAELQNNTLSPLVHCSHLSLSVFFLFLIGDGSQNIYTDIEMSRRKHRTVLALARDEEQFEAGRSAGKP